METTFKFIGDAEKKIKFNNRRQHIHYIINYLKDNVIMKTNLDDIQIHYKINGIYNPESRNVNLSVFNINHLHNEKGKICIMIITIKNDFINEVIFIKNLNFTFPDWTSDSDSDWTSDSDSEWKSDSDSPEWDLNPRPTDLQSAVLPS